MNKTFRLHRQHDMDLIALYRSKDFNFARELKKCLIAYATETEYIPPKYADNAMEGYVATSVTFHIKLSEDIPEQAAVLRLLGDVKYGYGNSFVKAVFRSYLPLLPLSAFSKENGMIMSKRAYVTKRVEEELVAKKEASRNASVAVKEKEEVTTADSHEREVLATTNDTSDSITVSTVNAEHSQSEENKPDDTVDMNAFMSSLGSLAHG